MYESYTNRANRIAYESPLTPFRGWGIRTAVSYVEFVPWNQTATTVSAIKITFLETPDAEPIVREYPADRYDEIFDRLEAKFCAPLTAEDQLRLADIQRRYPAPRHQS